MIGNKVEDHLSNVQVTIAKYDDLDRYITVLERLYQRRFTRVPEQGYYQSDERVPGEIGGTCRIGLVL